MNCRHPSDAPGTDDDDGPAPETGDPDGDAVDKAYSGLGFKRPHIANRAERANLDILQITCAPSRWEHDTERRTPFCRRTPRRRYQRLYARKGGPTVTAEDFDELHDKLDRLREELDDWADDLREIQPAQGRNVADDQADLGEVTA